MKTTTNHTPLSDDPTERVLQAAGECAVAGGMIPPSRLTWDEAGWRIDGRLADSAETRAVDELIRSGYLAEPAGSGRVYTTTAGLDRLVRMSAHRPRPGATDDSATRAKFAPQTLPDRHGGIGLF